MCVRACVRACVRVCTVLYCGLNYIVYAAPTCMSPFYRATGVMGWIYHNTGACVASSLRTFTYIAHSLTYHGAFHIQVSPSQHPVSGCVLQRRSSLPCVRVHGEWVSGGLSTGEG